MKKYALKNSYFKNRFGDMPDTILEIAKYHKEHGELPFRYEGENWVYDAFCERQKRSGVQGSQYLTPEKTVERMLHFAGKYFTRNEVLEPCCGTGQITKELLKDGYNVSAFDIDCELVELCNFLYPELDALQSDYKDLAGNYSQIISNPPYEELTDFLEWILSVQGGDGISILLIPKGFIRKGSPKRLTEILSQFSISEMEDMQEDFERTKTKAEIVILKKTL
jgi:SAM-dependent methyltransferase